MTKVIVDATLPSKLPGFDQPVELCDEKGQVMGCYFPVLDVSKYEPLEPQVSDEELLRRSQSSEKTYSTAEVLAYLEKL